MKVSLIQQYFDRSAKRYPRRTALSFQGEEMTYGALAAESGKIAAFLASAGIRRGSRVCFCIPKSPAGVAAVLGILKADAAYVPLDEDAPAARLGQIAADCGAAALLCVRATLDKMLEARKACAGSAPLVLCLDGGGEDSGPHVFGKKHMDQTPRKERYQNTERDLAYILYTSGSSGIPKGVMISHANVTSFIEWAAKAFRVTARDRLSQFTPFFFDLSTFDLYAAFKAGARLCLVPKETALFGEKLLRYIQKEKMSIWFSVPSVLIQILKSARLSKYPLPALRTVIFGGEVFPPRFLAEWMKAFPGRRFFNIYGPTEATVMITYHEVRKIPGPDSPPIPIGKACGHARVFALREDGRRARRGETGEMTAGGKAVGMGYWNPPAASGFSARGGKRIYRTGDVVRLGADGNYHYLGRRDFQVKYRGHRIELAEIESALCAQRGIEGAAVLADFEGGTVKKIVAFVEGPAPVREEVLDGLRKKLPVYMLPQEIRFAAALPRTASGKIDRQALSKTLETS